MVCHFLFRIISRELSTVEVGDQNQIPCFFESRWFFLGKWDFSTCLLRDVKSKTGPLFVDSVYWLLIWTIDVIFIWGENASFSKQSFFDFPYQGLKIPRFIVEQKPYGSIYKTSNPCEKPRFRQMKFFVIASFSFSPFSESILKIEQHPWYTVFNK